MRVCPICGAFKPKGSRFCGECDSVLPGTRVDCPVCGVANLASVTHCQECGAHIVAEAPTADQGDAGKEEDSVGGVSPPSHALDQGQPIEDSLEAVEEARRSSDWLTALRGLADEADDDVGETTRNGEHTAPTDSPEPTGIPDWLYEIGPLREASGAAGETSVGSTLTEQPGTPASPDGDRTEPGSAREHLDLSPAQAEGHDESTGGEADTLETSARSDEHPLVTDGVTGTVRDAAERHLEAAGASEEGFDGPEPGQHGHDETRPTETREEEVRSEERPPAQVYDGDPAYAEPSDAQQEILPATSETLESPEGHDTTSRDPAADGEESRDIERSDRIDQASAVGMDRAENSTEQREESRPDEGPLSEEPATRSDEIPSWLPEAESEAGLVPQDPIALPEAPIEGFELPEWLDDLMADRRTGAQQALGFEEETTRDQSGLSRDKRWIDAPDWLQELGPDRDNEASEGPVETEGPLKGLRDLLPAAPGIEAPYTHGPGSVARAREVSRARAELLESLLGEPVSKPRRTVADKGPDVERIVEGWNIAIVLLISVLGILLARRVTGRAVSLTRPVADPAAAMLHEIVGSLDTADDVLIAFDYGPAEADELNRVAQPVLEHLMDLGPGVAIVSTRPDGLPVAAALMSEITDSSDQYTLLGYRPGAATAVSQLLAATDTPPSLLLVLTSRPGPLLRWVEQAKARYGDELRVAAAGSALIEPLTTPYLDANAGQVSAAIHGLRGAAAYEALLGARGRATEQLDALAVGHIAIVGIMIAGAVKYGLGEPGTRKH